MPTSNLRRKQKDSRETVASCLCWDRRVPCCRVVCDEKERQLIRQQLQEKCVCTESAAVTPPAAEVETGRECHAAEEPPVDCRAVKPPACPY